MSGLTGAVFHDALAAAGAVGGQITDFNTLAAGATDALRSAGAGLTPAGAAAFLATCAEESASFRTTTEYGSSLSYDPYRGRTFIQLTWSSNYAGFGAWCHGRGLVSDPQTFVNNPASLSDMRWAWLGAVYYFATHGIWTWANEGNFLAVSQAVNGGNGSVGTNFTPNGWAARQAMYRVFSAAGTDLLPAAAAPTIPEDAMQLPPIPLTGSGAKRFFTDTVGAPGQCIGREWLTLFVDGPDGATATVNVYPQRSGGGTGPEHTLHAQVLTDGSHTSSADGLQLPSSTNQATLQWTVSGGATAYLVPAFTPAGQ